MSFLQRGRGDRQGRLVSNVVLLGLCGSGKTSIGSHLARRMGFGFLDLDQWIEAFCKKAVTAVFAEDGEGYFRAKESEAILAIANVCNHVIAVGGGGVITPGNWESLSQIGTTVWINCAPTMIAKRLLASTDELTKRPLLADLASESDPASRFARLSGKLEELLKERRSWYEQAQFIVNESFAPPDDCARRLKRLLESRQASKTLKKTKKPQTDEQVP